MDAKGRVSIPAAFREQMERRSEKPPILTSGPAADCLSLHPFDLWERDEKAMLDTPQMDPDVEELWRAMEGDAVDTPVGASVSRHA